MNLLILDENFTTIKFMNTKDAFNYGFVRPPSSGNPQNFAAS